MRYLEASVDQPRDDRDPMHQFVVEDDRYGPTRLLAHSRYADAEHAALFHVAGPREPYEQALAERASIADYAIDARPDGTCYLFVHEAMPAEARAIADAFDRPGLLVTTPVVYRPDGTVGLTAVGPAAAVTAAVEAIPETMGVDVEAVGEFAAGRLDTRLELTQRQLEAVRAAVDAGYYREPREATLADVAARLGSSTGTVGELLRRAERTVMASLADGSLV